MLSPSCPSCLGPLDGADDALRCDGCSVTYRSLRGIPDLRTADDTYLSNADDWSFATRLDEQFDRLDFRGLLDLYFKLSPEITPSQRARQVDHILTAPARAGAWVAALGEVPAGPWLDLGTGSGSFLAASAGSGPTRVGLDVALRWLLIARKRLDEEGLGHVRLVCGNAERLPFVDGQFAAIVAGDVVEHVADQPATLREAHRALIPGGKLFLASPNRLSLAPEPHVGAWGVGFLPRRWMAPYVSIVRKSDFRSIRTLSYAGWKSLLSDSPFPDSSIATPKLPTSDLATMSRPGRILARAYNSLVQTRPGRLFMRAFGPLFHVVATRRDPHPTSPEPRRPTSR